MKRVWAITRLPIDVEDKNQLERHLPKNIYPVSLKIELSASPNKRILTYGENNERAFSERDRFNQRTFNIYQTEPALSISERVKFINPLFEEGNINYKDFLDDLKNAKEIIEESMQPTASERIYLGDFKFCAIPERFAKKGFENWDSDHLYEEERCFIVQFAKASSEDEVIQITGEAKRKDGLFESLTPIGTSLPCTLSSVKRVYTKKPPRIRRKVKEKAFWTERKLKNDPSIDPRDWQSLRPKEWNRDDGNRLNDIFEESFEKITQKDDYPFFRAVELEGVWSKRDYLKVKKGIE